MSKLPVVAIVGRPNVGKSTLFNRIVQKRISIVEDQPGATRDRIYSETEWLTQPFRVIDTGGLQLPDSDLQTQINYQVEIALKEADLIIFLLSYQEGMTSEDQYIARLLRRFKKPIILCANKYDNTNKDNDKVYDFMELGMGMPFLVSSVHGIGMGELLDEVIKLMPLKKASTVEKDIKFCIIGKPNVGKSSLVNAILNQTRAIVSSVAGTTTDAVDTPFTYNKKSYVVIDTAGIRRKGKIQENLERYSLLRTHAAIERSNIVIFVIDGSLPINEQDLTIAGLGKNYGKPVVILVNKWDLIEKDSLTMEKFKKEIRAKFKYLEYSFIIFASALQGDRINKLFETLEQVEKNMTTRIQTSVLNEVINKAQLLNEAPDFKGGRLRIYYVTQVTTSPPTFVMMVNSPDYVHFSYERYLMNQLRQAFGFEGVPIKILFRARRTA